MKQTPDLETLFYVLVAAALFVGLAIFIRELTGR